MTTDLEMAKAASSGDATAWNTFVQRYGDLVLSAVVAWGERECRVPRSHYDFIERTIRGGKPEPAEEPDMDREVLALYRYTMEHLRSRLAAYQGKSSMGGWLRLVLRDIYRQYLQEADGRLTVPAAVAALPAFEQRVYRLGTHMRGRSAIAQALGATEEAVAEAQRKLRQALKPTSKDWWTLESWQGDPALGPCDQAEVLAADVERRLSSEESEALASHVAGCPACRESRAFLEEAQSEGGIAPGVAAPTWVNRAVMDTSASDAPEPQAAKDSWQRKAMSQPDWLLGVAVGAVATALVLLVLIPRLEYGKAVREPGDVAIARAAQPLSPPVAKQLADARDLLGKNKLDPAIQNLKAVLAVRPDNQEARWLLASTFDRMGDQIQAAQQYKIFLDTEKREQAIVDDRVRRAQARLGAWEETP